MSLTINKTILFFVGCPLGQLRLGFDFVVTVFLITDVTHSEFRFKASLARQFI